MTVLAVLALVACTDPVAGGRTDPGGDPPPTWTPPPATPGQDALPPQGSDGGAGPTPPMSTAIDFGDGRPLGCRHEAGGAFAHEACTIEWQCCNGAFVHGTVGCGAPCLCLEETGATGCRMADTTPPPMTDAGTTIPPTGDSGTTPPPPPPVDAGTTTPPPTGATCMHTTQGGVYANTACSEGYQCCNGSWRARSSGCGTCYCVEPTGMTGCGTGGGGPVDPPPPPPPPTGSVNQGLSQGGSEIPRMGLSNSTGTLSGTEPLGTVVTEAGAMWVRGKISHFGGPNDTGVSASETGAITGENLRGLNNPLNPSASVLMSRPEDYYYVAMRWNYSPNGPSFWRGVRLVIRNPANGRQVVVRPVDWGPNQRTGRIIDVSPQTETDLGANTDDNVDVAFTSATTPLGPVE